MLEKSSRHVSLSLTLQLSCDPLGLVDQSTNHRTCPMNTNVKIYHGGDKDRKRLAEKPEKTEGDEVKRLFDIANVTVWTNA